MIRPLLTLLGLLLIFSGEIHHSAAAPRPLQESELNRAARLFRLQIYATYRNDRAEYDRRAEQAGRMLDNWRKRGSSQDEVATLIQWFRAATRASQQNTSMPVLIDRRQVAPDRASSPAASPPVESSRLTSPPPARVVIPPPPTAPAQLRSQRALAGSQPTPADPPPPRVVLRVDPQRLASTLPEKSPAVTPFERAEVTVSPQWNPDGAPDVDLAVLASRIRAFNLTWSEIESELSQPGPWPVERLKLLMDQVDQLLGRRRVSQLYLNALSPLQQQQVNRLVSTDHTFHLLDQRLFEAQVALMDSQSRIDPSLSQQEMNQLHSLSERVKTWSDLRE